ncbi:MAG TPA: N-methyl-L-tryptophan oxidase [Polyangiaceae bacterium]
MSARCDVLVLGVGGMGAAALAHLASRGLSVIGVEQDRVPSERGSSVGETRVIRKAYAEDPRYVPLLERAYVLWRALEAESGEALFVRTGCLNIGPPGHPAIAGVLASVARHGLPHQHLQADELRARFALEPAAGDEGIFEEDAGFLRVEACTRAHARRAQSCGAELRTRTPVCALDVTAGGVRATLADGETLSADRAVVAAGPWLGSAPALREVARALRLTVERQVQLWFRPTEPARARPPTLPAFIHFTPRGAFYGIPPDDAPGLEPAVKVCRHHGGEATTADALDRAVRPDDEETVRAYLRAHLPAAAGPLVRSRVCMYTNTPDEHFVVGALARWPHVVVLGGFSGHGYKMASVIGEIAADLLTEGRCAFDLTMFDPARFHTS